MNNGDRLTGIILEYADNKLRLKTQNGELEIPGENISLIDFSPGKSEISGMAYIHFTRGKQLLELGADEEAREEFKAAIKESPKYAEAYYEVGKLLEKRGQVKQASEYFSRAVILAPGKLGPAKYLIDAADSYFRKGKVKSAAEAYYRVFTDYPDDLSAEYAAYRSGFIYLKDLNENTKGFAILSEAVRKYPKSAQAEEALYHIGRILSEEGSLVEAERTFKQLIAKYPSGMWKDDAQYMLGMVYFMERRNREAVEEFTKALELTIDPALIKATRIALNDCIWNIYKTSDGLPSDDIKAIVQDGDYIWIGTAEGLTRFNLSSNSFDGDTLLKETGIQALDTDNDFLWVGTSRSEIKRLDKKSGNWEDFLPKGDLTNIEATYMSIDSENLWIGTVSDGIWRYNKHNDKWTNYKTHDGLNNDGIISIASTPYGVWCGTNGGGIFYFDNSTSKWIGIPESQFSASRYVSSISIGLNDIWFSWYSEKRNGASRYNPIKKTWDDWVITEWSEDLQLPSNAGNNIIHLGACGKETWVGVDNGILIYDQKSSSWSTDPISYPSKFEKQVPVNVLICSKSLWFATSRGLGRIDREVLERIIEIKK